MYYIFVCICGMEATLSFFQCFLPSLFLFAWKLTQIHGFAPTPDGSHVYTSISAEIVLLVTIQDHTRKTNWKITWSTKPLRGKSSSLMMGDEPHDIKQSSEPEFKCYLKVSLGATLVEKQMPAAESTHILQLPCNPGVLWWHLWSQCRPWQKCLQDQFFTSDKWRISEFCVSVLY